jgi:UDP-galactose transporter B1
MHLLHINFLRFLLINPQILSLSMDGLTGAVQERMKSEFQTKSGHMMYNINLWSIAYLAAASVGTNEVGRFIEFVGKFPFILNYVLAFSILSALGQVSS